MPDWPILMIVFENPYGWGFFLFWLSILAACTALWFIENHHGRPLKKIESFLFWTFGLVMLAFTIFRPIGIARDDLPYLEIYESICPTLKCGKWLQGERDMAWYSSVGILKSFVPDPKIMLWLCSLGLLIKLAVMFDLSRRPLICLLVYFSLYYQLHDLTSWRVSLAIAFFMLAIWFVVRWQSYWNGWTMFLAGFFHKQAFVAPLVFAGCFIKKSRFFLIFSSLVPVFLLSFGIFPQLHLIVSQINESFKTILLYQGLDAYITAKLAGTYLGWRNAPIVVYPQIFLTLWLLIKVQLENDKMESILNGCLVMACLFLWAFASTPDAQIRFFEFFMLPTVLLAGIRRLNGFELLGVIFVSSLFIAKYNIIHQLIGNPPSK